MWATALLGHQASHSVSKVLYVTLPYSTLSHVTLSCSTLLFCTAHSTSYLYFKCSVYSYSDQSISWSDHLLCLCRALSCSSVYLKLHLSGGSILTPKFLTRIFYWNLFPFFLRYFLLEGKPADRSAEAARKESEVCASVCMMRTPYFVYVRHLFYYLSCGINSTVCTVKCAARTMYCTHRLFFIIESLLVIPSVLSPCVLFSRFPLLIFFFFFFSLSIHGMIWILLQCFHIRLFIRYFFAYIINYYS